ncbi:MAG: hypothetical protein F6J90_15320 [Moorea sp. SIOASIH]|uniref:hypothetical protein n=1 Tax=Moorena sp. SIOASIH TaxID=2607817 RepID=UPI0013BA87C5|nr:hypothetical protein [Moorena sp. SIOASIH]NEO37624.1 hypothetical protein [Moorena sp. SIOASIH]
MAEARQQQACIRSKKKATRANCLLIGSLAKQGIQNNTQPASRPVSIAAPSTLIKYYVYSTMGVLVVSAKANKIVTDAFFGQFPQGTRIKK